MTKTVNNVARRISGQAVAIGGVVLTIAWIASIVILGYNFFGS
jgi:hypothetical protein